MNEVIEINEIAVSESRQRTATLYELETELQELLAAELEDENPTEERWAQFTTLLFEQLPKNIAKRERVGQFIRHCELQAENRKVEIARLQKGKKFFEHVAARTRASLEYVLKALGRNDKGKWPKLEGHTLRLGLRDNPPKVKVLDEHAIPPQYKRYTLTIWGDTWAEILNSIPAPLRQRVVEEINERKMNTEVSATRIKKAIIEDRQDVEGADIETTQSVVIS